MGNLYYLNSKIPECEKGVITMKSVFEMEKDELITLLNKDIAEIKGEFHYSEDFKEECEADLYRFEKEIIEKKKTTQTQRISI